MYMVLRFACSIKCESFSSSYFPRLNLNYSVEQIFLPVPACIVCVVECVCVCVV